MDPLPVESVILNNLLKKADTKQEIYYKTKEAYRLIRNELTEVSEWVRKQVARQNVRVEVKYQVHGDFETELRFGGDTLFYIMHTNVFTFPPEHFIFKTDYVKQDPYRAYCGMILIYNFLSDTIRYNRMNDMGYLLGRLFINKEGHYFMQGKRQYSFKHRDFANIVLTQEAVRDIVEISITQAIEFDLYAPPIEAIEKISYADKIAAMGNIALATGKRLGFDLDREEKDNDLSMSNSIEL